MVLAELKVDNIYIVCGYTDMRKSIAGLSAIIIQQFQMRPDEHSMQEQQEFLVRHTDADNAEGPGNASTAQVWLTTLIFTHEEYSPRRTKSPTSFDSFQTSFDCFTDQGAVSGAPLSLRVVRPPRPAARTPRTRVTVHSSSTGYVHVLEGCHAHPLPSVCSRQPSAQNPLCPRGYHISCALSTRPSAPSVHIFWISNKAIGTSSHYPKLMCT